MELRDLDPAFAAALREQQVTLEQLAGMDGGKAPFGRMALKLVEPFQNAMTGESLRNTPPEDVMEAVGRLAGYLISATAIQFSTLAPKEQLPQALAVMTEAMMRCMADYSSGMLSAHLNGTAPGVRMAIHESGPVEVATFGAPADRHG